MRTLVLWLVCGLVVVSAHSQPLVINEVMSSNGLTIADDDGDFSDWIELYNAGDATVDLGGYRLTDDPSNPARWVFPPVMLDAGGRLIVWASGKDRVTAQHLHASFALARDGETIVLSDASGAELDRIAVPALPRDVSFGRAPDGGASWRYFTEPSPGGANTGASYALFLDAPTFSTAAGFHSVEFDLELSTADPDAVIHYTLDGSMPDESSRRYDGPITIRDRSGDPNTISTIQTSHTYHAWAPPMGVVNKGTVVRAIAMQDGALPSDVVTRTFFIEDEGPGRYSFPVITIATDSVGLFGGAEGLFVPGDDFYDYIRNRTPTTNIERQLANYAERGEEWERPIHMEMFIDGRQTIDQEAGMRIHGGLSRLYRQKSLRIYARGRYGESVFPEPLFDEKPEMLSRRIILRSSGQDWTKTMMRDAFMQRLVRHMDVDYQAYEPAVLFINGEYWGIHNIRERIDQYYFEGNHGADPDRVDHLTGSGTVKEGSSADFIAIRSFVSQNDMRNPSNYAHVESEIDLSNFIDYHIAQIFFRNNDWPHQNIDFWRAQPGSLGADGGPGGDGRWRWVLFDTDFGFGWSADPWDRDMIAWARSETGNGHGSWATVIFRRLLMNETFRNRFIARLADQLNTAFRPDHVIALIDEFERRLEPEIGEHIHRWGWRGDHSRFHQTPANVAEWNDNIEVLREFARVRPGYVRSHLRTNFSLGAPVTLTVDVSQPGAGIVQVNSLRIDEETVGVGPDPYPWSGSYYREVPVQLVAVPSPGYRFDRWEGTISGDTDTLVASLQGTTSVTARFVPDEAWLADVFPQPHDLSAGPYAFQSWPSTASAGTFPDAMAFYYMDEVDPGLEAQPAAPTGGAYDLESRTRIVGLGDAGIAFINTGNEEGNPGYPGRRLGAAVLALDTRDRTQIDVTWTGGTVVPNVRKYNLRLQYRLGDEGPLFDVLDADGRPVEYVRSAQAGHSESVGPIRLPQELEDRPYVQLWWRYYYTGEQTDGEGGARDMLRLADVLIESLSSVSAHDNRDIALPSSTALYPNYPNPFNPSTTIRFDVAQPGGVRIAVYDVLGRQVELLVDESLPAGTHHVEWHAGSAASGLYLLRLEHGGVIHTRTAMLLK